MASPVFSLRVFDKSFRFMRGKSFSNMLPHFINSKYWFFLDYTVKKNSVSKGIWYIIHSK